MKKELVNSDNYMSVNQVRKVFSSLNTILYQISIQKGNDPHNSSLIQAYFSSCLPLYQRHFNRQQTYTSIYRRLECFSSSLLFTLTSEHLLSLPHPFPPSSPSYFSRADDGVFPSDICFSTTALLTSHCTPTKFTTLFSASLNAATKN